MVYLCDDDVDDLEIVQVALIQNSYKGPVKTVLNGQALMDDLHNINGQQKPDVILLDLNMPLKDGFKVLKEIKGDPKFNTIPVIVLTSSSNKNDEIRCIELGCRYFFKKPFSMQEYQSVIMVVKGFIPNENQSTP